MKKPLPSLINKHWLSLQVKVINFLPVLVLAFWILIGAVATNNFSNLTQESQRRDLLFTQQPSMLFVNVVDDNGKIFNISQLVVKKNKIFIAEFIYTQCKTLCLSLGNMFQQAQAEIIKNNLSEELGLISISFDVANESVSSLQSYRKRMQANSEVWELVKLHDLKVLEAVKSQLGLMVIENDQKDYIHNSAFIVISQQGHLIGIYDPTELSTAIDFALGQLTL